MVLVKKWPFFKLFFFGNIGQKNVFYDSLKRENDFLCHKKKSLKSRKVEIFPKALTHRLGQKGAIFPTFFLGNIGQKNVFYDILEPKNYFLRHKNNKFKNSKSWDFSKGVNPWFLVKKWPFLQLFFFGNIGHKNVFCDILKRKNEFLCHKNNKFKKSKNWDFSKGVNKWFWTKNGHFSNFFF